MVQPCRLAQSMGIADEARRSRSPLRHAWMSAPEVLHSTVPTIGLTRALPRDQPRCRTCTPEAEWTRGNVAVVGRRLYPFEYHASSGHTHRLAAKRRRRSVPPS